MYGMGICENYQCEKYEQPYQGKEDYVGGECRNDDAVSCGLHLIGHRLDFGVECCSHLGRGLRRFSLTADENFCASIGEAASRISLMM